MPPEIAHQTDRAVAYAIVDGYMNQHSDCFCAPVCEVSELPTMFKVLATSYLDSANCKDSMPHCDITGTVNRVRTENYDILLIG